MKKSIHPVYRSVVFQDVQANKSFITRSTVYAKDTISWEDGKTYPLYKVDISAFSHLSPPASSASWTRRAASTAWRSASSRAAGKTVERKAAKGAGKRLAHVGHTAKREKVLSTAPTKEQKAAAKKTSAPKKDKAPAKKDA